MEFCFCSHLVIVLLIGGLYKHRVSTTPGSQFENPIQVTPQFSDELHSPKRPKGSISYNGHNPPADRHVITAVRQTSFRGDPKSRSARLRSLLRDHYSAGCQKDANRMPERNADTEGHLDQQTGVVAVNGSFR